MLMRWQGRNALYILVGWQVGVLLVALVGHLLPRPPLLSCDGRTIGFVESLFQPDSNQVGQSRALFEGNRQVHIDGFGKAVAPNPAIAVDELGIPLSLGPPPERALEAINRGFYHDNLVPIVLELPNATGKSRDSVWKDLARNAAAIVLFINERYSDAAELFAGEHAVYANEFKTARDSFERLAVDANDFENRLALVRALGRMSYSAWLSHALCDQYWRLAELAKSDAERAQLLQDIQCACVSGYSAPPWTWRRDNLIAACRLSASDGASNLDIARAVVSLADLEEEKGDPALAATMFQTVADRYPNSPKWGRCVYNAGVLYSRLGVPKQAIATLERVFPSKVNDLEPGSHLMEAYRNYRYNAAIQIGEAYKQLWNFPMSYVWHRRAASRYMYRSWCGTCAAGERRAQSRRLLLVSLEAGPAFFVGNLALSPVRNWMVILGLGMACWVLRWRRRRLTAAVLGASNPP